MIPRVGDMKALDLAPESFDLIWCEGALFILGFEPGLRVLRPLLRGPAVLVMSETAWLRPIGEVPCEVPEFWNYCGSLRGLTLKCETKIFEILGNHIVCWNKI